MKYTAITPPDWLGYSAIYQINPRTFSKEGTIRAVTEELKTIRELGFRVVYLCPIFTEDDSEDRDFWSIRQKKSETGNPKNPYRMNDYFSVDVEYGTADDLHAFVKEAHALGMRVLLDLVYLHIGPEAEILKLHPEFARQDRDGNPICGQWNFPLLDYRCSGLREYLWCNMVYYISVFDVDGFRCDVADGVPLDFWTEGKRRIRAVKSDAVLIEEGVNKSFLAESFESLYFFDWHETIYSVIQKGGNRNAIRETWEKWNSDAPKGMMSLHGIDNHDTVTDWPKRVETLIGHSGMELLEAMTYVIDGIPMVYAGNELGDEAKLSLFANRFHMGKFETTDRSIASRDYSIRRQTVMKALNRLKETSDVLRFGKTFWLSDANSGTVVAFSREYSGKSITFIGNLGDDRADFPSDKAESRKVLLSSESTPVILGGKVSLEPWTYITIE